MYILDKYYLNVEDLDKYNCDFVIHGDDIILDQNGESIYTKFIKQGKFKMCKRTTGISTTDIQYKLLNINTPNFS